MSQEVGGHEQLPELAERLATRYRRRGGVMADRQQGPIGLTDLPPHRRVHVADIRERYGLQNLWLANAGCRRAGDALGSARLRSGNEAEQKQRGRDVASEVPSHTDGLADHRFTYGSDRPVPSVRVNHRSTAMSVHSSARPLGQITSTRCTAGVRPRPTSTRGSLADA